MRNITNNQPFWGNPRVPTTHSPRSQHTPHTPASQPTTHKHTSRAAVSRDALNLAVGYRRRIELQQHLFRRRKDTIRNNQMAGRVGRGYLKARLMWQKGETVRRWIQGNPAAHCSPIISVVQWPSNIRQKERIMTITQQSARALRWIYSCGSSSSRPTA